ncbi:MAG: transcriptional regulator NrdR [Gammaproteobacteria bacterium]|nr:transcriptional regulator NrdR [Gammaproteobacteria bacterium]
MYCPFCNAPDTKVIDTRLGIEGEQVKRRRECQTCNERFTTFEIAELDMPRVVKRDGLRVPFVEQKLRISMLKALEKRPVSTEQVDQQLRLMLKSLRTCGEKEVSSRQIGELVMGALLVLDEVAYVRFASVYHSFGDLDEFKQEIQRLKSKRLKREI